MDYIGFFKYFVVNFSLLLYFYGSMLYVLFREGEWLINKSLGVNFFEIIVLWLCLIDEKMVCDF